MLSKKRAEQRPGPLIVQSTGEYGGNDGRWSTFYINVGDKENNGGGQTFKALPSTWFGVTVLPSISSWCNDDCASNRGIGPVNGREAQGFVTEGSSTWNQAGPYNLSLPHWWPNPFADNGAHNGALYGTDLIGMGAASPDSYVLQDMLVASTPSEDFYLGQLGLAAGATTVGFGKGSIDSVLSTYKSTDIIHSVSYGYTAGASYRNNGNGVPGSLVLGGYDETRINVDNAAIDIPMPSENNNTLVVGVQNIDYTPSSNVEQNTFSFTNTQGHGGGFLASIDSTTPYLWLPDAVIDGFAERFFLRYDNRTERYSVNSTGAAHNRQQNATVSFRLGKDPFGSDGFATIYLPWTAFDLPYAPPEGGNSSQYFPIKKSENGMFVLGRTLLQEAYIIVDYGRANFTVAPAVSPDRLPDPKLVPIYDKAHTAPSPTPLPKTGGDKGLSGGAIAGIVVGILVVALCIAFGIFMWWKKRRERQNAPPPNYKEATEIDTTIAGNAVKLRRVSELDSGPTGSYKPAGLGGFYGDNRDGKDLSPFPAINEMESPPAPVAELYSPPGVASTPHSEGAGTNDYFIAGSKIRGHLATGESSANNTPGTPPSFFTPMAELPGEEVGRQVRSQQSDAVAGLKRSPTPRSGSNHKRDLSATPSQNNIDEVMKQHHSVEPPPARPAKDESTAEGVVSQDKKPTTDAEGDPLERRPSHTRGLSDTTVQSDITVVSQPTPEELEQWALADEQPRRPLSE